MTGWGNGHSQAYRIIGEVCRYYGCDSDELIGPRRGRQYVVPRHTAMFAVAEGCPHLSLLDLGAIFRRDHTTVMYALGRLKAKVRHGRADVAVARAILWQLRARPTRWQNADQRSAVSAGSESRRLTPPGISAS